MAIGVVRAGSHGEYELKFIEENRVYVTWDGLDVNIGKLSDRSIERVTRRLKKLGMSFLTTVNISDE